MSMYNNEYHGRESEIFWNNQNRALRKFLLEILGQVENELLR